MRRTLLVCILLGVSGFRALGAQGTQPLLKADLVRLLTSPLIPGGEVADVVRRNCLAFRPTERDWADLKSLGASADVLASVAGCGTTRLATAVTPTPALASLAVEPRPALPRPGGSSGSEPSTPSSPRTAS